MAGLDRSVLFAFSVLACSTLAFAAESRIPTSAQPTTTMRQSMANPFSNQVTARRGTDRSHGHT